MFTSLPDLATTTFSAKPNDKLATLDVYKSGSSSVVNSYQEITNKTTNDLVRTLTGSSDLSSAIKRSLTSGITLNKTDMIKRLMTTSLIQSGFNMLASSVKDKFSIPSTAYGSVTTTINGVVSKVAQSDVASMTGVSNMVNSLSGNSYGLSIQDNGAASGLISSLVKTGTSLGLSNVYSTLSRTQNGYLMSSALRQVLPASLGSGYHRSFMDIASSTTAGLVKQYAPMAVSTVAKNLNLGTSQKEQDLVITHDNIAECFAKVDPSWKTYERNGETIINGMTVAQSADLKKLNNAKAINDTPVISTPSTGGSAIQTTVATDEQYLAMMGYFDEMQVDSSLQNAYPTVALNSGNTKSSVVSSIATA